MKVRALLLFLATLSCAGAVVAQSTDAFMGTWKLNEAKSHSSGPAAHYTRVSVTPAGDQIKVEMEGTSSTGAPLHSEWVGKFDGKDYPVTGDPGQDMRSYEVIDDHTLASSVKKGGNVLAAARVTMSPDGKTRTVHATSSGEDGRKATVESVYERQ